MLVYTFYIIKIVEEKTKTMTLQHDILIMYEHHALTTLAICIPPHKPCVGAPNILLECEGMACGDQKTIHNFPTPILLWHIPGVMCYG